MKRSQRRKPIVSIPKRSSRRPQKRWMKGFLLTLAPLILFACLYGMWKAGAIGLIGQRLEQTYCAGIARMGLSLQTVDIEPMEYTSAEKVLEVARIYRGQPMASVDPESIRTNIETLPWVWSALVQRRFPSSLYIRVTERQPIAIWRQGKKTQLVDREGQVLSDKVAEPFQHLPVIAGEEAGTKAAELFEKLNLFPDLRARVKTAVLVGKRRWDLIFERQVIVMLPEEKMEDALSYLKELDQAKVLTSTAVRVIDLRLEDKAVLKLTPEATLKLQNKGQPKET